MADLQAQRMSDQIGPRLEAIERRLQQIEARLWEIERRMTIIPVAEYLPRG